MHAEVGKFPRVKCFTLTRNLSAQSPGFWKGSVRHSLSLHASTRHSTKANHLFEVNQQLLKLPCRKLITDVATRWNSSNDIPERFLEQQAVVHTPLLSPEINIQETDIFTLSRTVLAKAEESVKTNAANEGLHSLH